MRKGLFPNKGNRPFLCGEGIDNFCIINASMIGLEILILVVLYKFGRHSILFRKLINTNQYKQ